MSKRIAAFCMTLACAFLAQPAFCRDDASSIYDAVTASAPDGCPTIVLPRTDIRGIDDALARQYARMLHLDDALARSFASANKTVRALHWKPASARVALLEDSMSAGDGVDGSLLAKALKAHPCARYLFSFSAPAVLHGDAMLKVNRACGTLCGGGSDVVRLGLVDGRWRVVEWRRLSID